VGRSGPVAAPTGMAAMAEQQGARPAGAEGASLLVVEDFEPMSVLLVRVLSAEGYRVTPVATAHAVRAACAAEDFDLIVTDVHIPGGNGAEIVRDVAGERPGLRVLFVSGDAERDLDLHVPGGHTDFLQKPFDIYELAERVRRLLVADGGQA
jgi:DNA-binding response OmpR family regulator